jgi:hypothetical protein
MPYLQKAINQATAYRNCNVLVRQSRLAGIVEAKMRSVDTQLRRVMGGN